MGILLQHVYNAILRLACCALAASLGFAAPPNVVLIMADDVGYECFGFSGSKQYSTPQLDRIADSGVRFRNAFSTPLCTPSRVTIMTGKSNVRNYVDFGALAPGETTFAKLFHDAGYATAIAGKWQLQGSADAAGTPPAEAGFDTYCLWNTPLTKRPRYWTPSIEQDGKLLDLPADAYGPDVFSDFLIRFMERNRERPFFVYYPMALVHDPFLPTPDSADRNSKDEQRNRRHGGLHGQDRRPRRRHDRPPRPAREHGADLHRRQRHAQENPVAAGRPRDPRRQGDADRPWHPRAPACARPGLWAGRSRARRLRSTSRTSCRR
ncbi:MAG: sulfatase-like hydrolase/transferase [Bryobacterales bacterium]